MPFLGRFCQQGARARLRTIVPALTPPAWTSLITGRAPGSHGVFDFFEKDSPNAHTLRMVTSQDVHTPTVWALANRYGLAATALNFPVTFPAPPLNGYVVSGWMPWRQLRLGCHPANLYDRIKTLPGFDPRELAMDMAHEEKALEGCSPEEYEAWIDLHIRREQRWQQILDMVFAEQQPCEFVSVVFDGVDKLQHLFWRFLEPSHAAHLTTAWEQSIRTRCLSYFRQLDGILQHVVEQAGPDATVVLASDHGFGAQVRTFYVNTWLARQGHLAWTDSPQQSPDDRQKLGIGQIARHTYQLDWTRTRAYAPLPSGNGIHIVRADAQHPHGVDDAEYAAFCAELMAGLLALRDPVSGDPVVAEVWPRHAVFAGPKESLAPDLTLTLADGGLISILDAATVVAARPQVTGTHHPLGILIAGGPNIRPGVDLGECSILDVAPLLLYSLGLPIPDDLEGRLPTGLVKSDWLAARPPRRAGPSAPVNHAAAAEQTDTLEAEAALLNRLRALGYVE